MNIKEGLEMHWVAVVVFYATLLYRANGGML